jgi:hypothetical protein
MIGPPVVKPQTAKELKSDTRWSQFPVIVVLIQALGSASAVFLTGTREVSGVVPMDLRVLSVKEHCARALGVAQQWRREAVLNKAEALFAPADGLVQLSVSYGFHSAGPPASFLIVWIKGRGNALVVEKQGASFHRASQSATLLIPWSCWTAPSDRHHPCERRQALSQGAQPPALAPHPNAGVQPDLLLRGPPDLARDFQRTHIPAH